MIIGKLVKERYFQDINNTGLYYDLAPIKRGAGDESEYNRRIDNANIGLDENMPEGKVWRCTLYMLDSQLQNLSDSWKNTIAAKTYLMVYRPGQNVNSFDVQFWRDYGTDIFLWSSDDKVYSKLDANGLGDRYRIAKASEVEGAEDPTQPEYPDPYPDVIIAEPVKKWHAKGKLWFMDIDLTVEAEE